MNSQFAAAAQPLRSRSLFSIIVGSATEAFGSALVLWILGGVAIDIAGSFAGNMVPSPPPIFAAQPEGHHKHHSGGASWHDAGHGVFILFFAIFFAHSLWTGIRGSEGGPETRFRRIASRLREHWFGLIVGNAISAWVTTLVLSITQNFALM